MTDFDRLVADALAFFDDLAANNSRDWFLAHKPRYERSVKQPAEALLAELSDWLGAETGAEPVPKLYRINRDLRFSRDKTPYNTHLHLQWSDRASGICHLFGVSRAYVCAGVGAMAFDGPALDRWRDGVAGAAGADLAGELDGLLSAGHRLDPPELKRVPAPYEPDHARAALLKRKGIVVWTDFDAAARGHLVESLKAAFSRLTRFRTALAGIIAA